MDEIVGSIVEQVARRLRDAAAAQKTAVDQQAAANAAAVARARAAGRIVSPRRDVAKPPAPRPVVAAPAPAPAPPPVAALVEEFATLDFVDPFGVAIGASAAAAPAVVAPPNGLLGSFTSAPAFLAGFVLSEALAAPLALREPRRF